MAKSTEDVIFQTRDNDSMILKEPSQVVASKYFQPDGSTSAELVTDIGIVQKENAGMMMQGFEHLSVEDNAAARTKRVQEFEALCDGVKLELSACSKIEDLLNYGDKLLSTLTFDEVRDFPGSTDRSNLCGLVKVFLVQTSSNKMKVYFSITEGKYLFSASENFFQLIDPTGTLSTMYMKYTMDAKFVSQESTLVIDDSFIDGIAYRRGSNGVTAMTDAATLKAASQSCSIFSTCLSLSFIYCTSQYGWNPAYCGCCSSKCCEQQKKSDKFMFWLNFSAVDEFTVGKQTDQMKENEVVVGDVELEMLNCPVYCGGCCFVYQNPLKFGQTLIDANPITYCCPAPKPQDLSALAEGPKWAVEKRRHDELTMVLHYVNPLDHASHACTLVSRPGDDVDIDAKYNSIRKFLSILSDHRKPADSTSSPVTYANAVNLAAFMASDPGLSK